MADGKIHVEATGDVSRLISALNRAQGRMRKMESDMKRMQDQSATQARSQSRFLNTWYGRLMSIGAGYMSVASAINVVNQALQKKIQLEDRAIPLVMSEARAQEMFVHQIGPSVTNAERLAAIDRVRGISDRTLVPQAEVFQNAATLMSALSGNIENVAPVLEAGLPLTARMEASKRAEFLAFAGDLTKLGYEAKEAVSLVFAMQKTMRSTEIGQLAAVARPAFAAAVNVADDPAVKKRAVQEAAAVTATISQILADAGLEMSTTAAANLMATVRRLGGQRTEGMSPEELMDFAANDRAMQMMLLRQPESVLGRATAKEVVTAMLKGNDQFMRMYRESLEAIQDVSVEQVDTMKDFAIAGTPEMAAEHALRASKVAAERQTRTATDAAVAAAEARDIIEADRSMLRTVTGATELFGARAVGIDRMPWFKRFQALRSPGASPLPLDSTYFMLDMLQDLKDAMDPEGFQGALRSRSLQRMMTGGTVSQEVYLEQENARKMREEAAMRLQEQQGEATRQQAEQNGANGAVNRHQEN